MILVGFYALTSSIKSHMIKSRVSSFLEGVIVIISVFIPHAVAVVVFSPGRGKSGVWLSMKKNINGSITIKWALSKSLLIGNLGSKSP